MTRPKIEDERAGPPPGGVDLSTVRGMEELDGVFPGKSLDRSRILDTTVELDYRSGTVVLKLSVLEVPETRPPWWEEHCNGLSMSLSYQGDVRIGGVHPGGVRRDRRRSGAAVVGRRRRRNGAREPGQ